MLLNFTLITDDPPEPNDVMFDSDDIRSIMTLTYQTKGRGSFLAAKIWVSGVGFFLVYDEDRSAMGRWMYAQWGFGDEPDPPAAPEPPPPPVPSGYPGLMKAGAN